MARIVMGVGTPKTPQISLPPALWQISMGENDRRNLGARYADLVEARGGELEAELTPARFEARYNACKTSLDELSAALADVAPDVLVVFGDEDRDLSVDQNLPPFSIYTGETITVLPLSSWRGAEHLKSAMWAWYGESRAAYPAASDLATHVVRHLISTDFDVACSTMQPPGATFNSSFTFVLRRIIRGLTIPVVPIVLNAQFQNNRPTLKRCYAFGRAVREAIATWQPDQRVGVIAAGGLSHIVLDEAFDRAALNALRARDLEALYNLPESHLVSEDHMLSGTGEVRCWVAAAGALEHLSMQLLRYEPCYRTPAGTGCGVAFALWN